MKYLSLFLICFAFQINAQDEWTVSAQDIDANNYYGVTVANGVVGIVSSLNR